MLLSMLLFFTYQCRHQLNSVLHDGDSVRSWRNFTVITLNGNALSVTRKFRTLVGDDIDADNIKFNADCVE